MAIVHCTNFTSRTSKLPTMSCRELLSNWPLSHGQGISCFLKIVVLPLFKNYRRFAISLCELSVNKN